MRLGYLRADVRDALVGLQRTLQQQLGQFFLESGLLRPDELGAALSAQARHNVARRAGARAGGAARR